MSFVPLDRMWQRVELARDDSDQAFFQNLLFCGELVLKTVVLSLIAAIVEENERYQYGQYHRLVRANGIGDWAAVANNVVTGPPAQYIIGEASDELRSLTQREPPGSWQYNSVQALWSCIRHFVPESDALPVRLSSLRWLTDFAFLRNKTRGHGAPSATTISAAAPYLEHSLRTFTENFPVFARPWAHLHRNLSGKYRVASFGPASTDFDDLKKSRTHNMPNGTYVSFAGRPVHVELLNTDIDLTDFYYANGGFKDNELELLSYITGTTVSGDASPYMLPATDLPPSGTQGLGSLGLEGSCFTNLPPRPTAYIGRPELEKQLRKLLLDDRHLVISLAGSGGIGKTFLALTVLHDLVDDQRFTALIWFSARDVELLAGGPKPVRPHVVTERAMAEEYVRLLEPTARFERGFKAVQFLAEHLGQSPIGATLFVLDNFETVRNPIELFTFLDTYIRPPNKVLITTRYRDFKGDYPEEIHGMTDEQFRELVTRTADSLGIGHLLNAHYIDELYQEAEGHPYVGKVLLGEVAKAGRLTKIDRIIASREDILPALFERTYVALSPAAQRVFLTLCSWRSTVPMLALEAVLLRPENERIDVLQAVDELVRTSMIERTVSDLDGQEFLSVPLVAAVFGSRKLEASITKAAVEDDVRLLHGFGAAQRTDIAKGIAPRIKRLFQSVAQTVSTGLADIKAVRPVLEFVCGKYPPGWLLLAELYEEQGGAEHLNSAVGFVRRFIEASQDADPELRRSGWEKLAQLSHRTGDWPGEVHALVEAAQLPGASYQSLSNAATRINFHLAQRTLPFQTDERLVLIRKLISVMEARLSEADANDCSRLAWLCLNTHDEERARQFILRGLQIDPTNEHCLNVAARLGMLPLA